MDFRPFIQQRIDLLAGSNPKPETKVGGQPETKGTPPSNAQTQSSSSGAHSEPANPLVGRPVEDLTGTLKFLRDHAGESEHDFILLQLLIGEEGTPPDQLAPKLRALLANTTGDHAAMLEFVGAELLRKGYSKAVIEQLLAGPAPAASGPGVEPRLAERKKKLLGGMGDDDKAAQTERNKERLRARVDAAKGSGSPPRPEPAPLRPFEIETKSTTAPGSKSTGIRPQKDDKHSGEPPVRLVDDSSELHRSLFETSSASASSSGTPETVKWLLARSDASAPMGEPRDGALESQDDASEPPDEPQSGPPRPESRSSSGSVRAAMVADPELEGLTRSDPATAAERLAARVSSDPKNCATIARPVWERVLRSDVSDEWKEAFLLKFVEGMRQGEISAVRSTKGTLKGALNFVSGRLIAKAVRDENDSEKQRLSRQAIAIGKALDKLTERV